MKLLLLIALALYANAGWITTVQSATDSSISTEKRQLATYGVNPRAYVFTVETKDGAKAPMQCIIVYTEQDLGEKAPKSTAPVLQCIPLK
jgi:hypothetical protein